MKPGILIKTLFVLALVNGFSLLGQETNDDEDKPVIPKKSKFHTGFYIGSYFANKYNASNYSGYGFDLSGVQNTFSTSLMYQKIINEFGGGYGQTDQIALALGVDPHQWSFNEGDMPVNMHYVPAILVGLNFKIPVDKKSAFIVNVNGSKLSIEGNFTMSTFVPSQSPTNPAISKNLKYFPIYGKEQRLLMQLGFQRIFGDDEKLNFFGEIGLNGTLAKFDKNYIIINNLQIDLTQYINQTLYPSVPSRRPVGFGIGAFAGLGMNIAINPKFTLQLLYTLTHEKINFGTNPALKLQNGIGFRVYYNL